MRLRSLDLPVFPHPSLYAGDFNFRHVDWGYDDNSPDSECLAGWECINSINSLAILYNEKDATSFDSGRWNTGTNPDLVFASVVHTVAYRTDVFPKSSPGHSIDHCFLHNPGLVCKCQAFTKNLLPPDLLDVDAAYQDFCNIIKKATKKTIPRGYRNIYIPCWNEECESLYTAFLQSSQGDYSSLAATALLAKLDRKRRDPRLGAVWSIDFSHSTRKA